MAEAEIAVVRRWFEEVWNNGRPEVMDDLLTADAPIYGVGSGGELVRGPAGFRPGYEQLKGAFPDIHFIINEAISERDLVALRWTARMTHTGGELGPPSNKTVTVTGMAFARVRDGKMVEGWNNWDMMGLMHAIGQSPHPAIIA
ncbi:MAG TPA: ester cyclase [Stellaceae bacterium]|jgi:predicted ester cyclase|nr:ester cyclase [Stellaceae bacterium]